MAFHRLNEACNFVKCTSCSLVDHVYDGERMGIRELMSGGAGVDNDNISPPTLECQN